MGSRPIISFDAVNKENKIKIHIFVLKNHDRFLFLF